MAQSYIEQCSNLMYFLPCFVVCNMFSSCFKTCGFTERVACNKNICYVSACLNSPRNTPLGRKIHWGRGQTFQARGNGEFGVPRSKHSRSTHEAGETLQDRPGAVEGACLGLGKNTCKTRKKPAKTTNGTTIRGHK